MAIHDLTKRGGWKDDLPVEAVAGFIDIADLWPGDTLIVRPKGARRCTLHFTGLGDFVLKNHKGVEVGRFARPTSKKP